MEPWDRELETARNEEDLVRKAADYLVLSVPRGLDAMDLGLNEMRIRSSYDIERVQRALRRRDAWPPAESAELAGLRALASYFDRAAEKVGSFRAQ